MHPDMCMCVFAVDMPLPHHCRLLELSLLVQQAGRSWMHPIAQPRVLHLLLLTSHRLHYLV